MKKIVLLLTLLLSNTNLFGAQGDAPAAKRIKLSDNGAAANQKAHVPSLQSIATLSTLQMMNKNHQNICKNAELFNVELNKNKGISDPVKNQLITKYKEISLEAARLWIRDDGIGFTPLYLLKYHKPELARLIDQNIIPWHLNFQDIIDAGGADILASKIKTHEKLRTGFFKNLCLTSLKGLQNIPGIIKIDKLHLDENQLTTIPQYAFNGLNELKQLILYKNQLTEIHPDTFNGLDLLKQLILANNQLTKIHQGAFNGLNELVLLDLLGNQLTEIHDGVFKGLDQLRLIILYDNEFPRLKQTTIISLIKSQVPENCRINL
ncbi:MAG: leucine-rich repeat domain-containing protein [Saprospiraceae bacterium]|nr:leucine-rich repeat domain-containing protein [Saprospiraceae bacterium]